MCFFQEPLNSEDDVSDEEGQELFDTENVVVCQYDKVNLNKKKKPQQKNHPRVLCSSYQVIIFNWCLFDC